MRLILEMELEADSTWAGDQVADAIKSLQSLRERLYDGEKPAYQSDVITDSTGEDEFIGNWRIEP